MDEVGSTAVDKVEEEKSDRTIIIPDIHAGYHDLNGGNYSRVDELVKFLEGLLDESLNRLLFIGDVFELWRADRKTALDEATPLLNLIPRFVEKGVQVDYMIGNHDYNLLHELANPIVQDPPILGAWSANVNFHHRYLILQHGAKRVLITHGDDYDLLYIPLQWVSSLLPIPLTANDIYLFYDWVYAMPKEVIADYEKNDLRGLLLEWIKSYVKNLVRGGGVGQRQPGSSDPLAAETVAAATQVAVQSVSHQGVVAAQKQNHDWPTSPFLSLLQHPLTAFQSGVRAVENEVASLESGLFHAFPQLNTAEWLDLLETVNLNDIVDRTPQAQTWEIPNYNPYSKSYPIGNFQPYDHLIVGHFHWPRQDPSLRVTDCGSWVRDPKGKLLYDTYAEVISGEVRLWQYPNQCLATAKL